jgi:hypothetical protein
VPLDAGAPSAPALSVNFQWTFSERLVKIYWTKFKFQWMFSGMRRCATWCRCAFSSRSFSELSVNIQWTFSENLLN